MAAKKGGLGRGLDALFENASVDNIDIKDDRKESISDNGIIYVDINDVRTNAAQPRKTFDEDKLEELAESIRNHGIIQPVVLRRSENGYEIVAGERRYRAARKAGLKKLPCIIKELTDEENMLLAIIENMQREDLNPIEEAEGLSNMIEKYGMTQEQISKSVGKSRPYISNAIRLLRLPDAVREYTRAGTLSAGHARAIAGIEKENEQLLVAEKTIKDGMSVRALEKYIASMNREKKPPKEKGTDVLRMEEELKDIFGTKINISRSPKKGKIEIEYYSREDLDRIIELLRGIDV